EGDVFLPRQSQLAALANRLQTGREGGDINMFRLLSLQPEQHGLVATVTFAGGAQRTVKLNLDAGGGVQQGRAAKSFGKARGGSHRPYGMRAGRADTDLEQIENAEGHATLRR